MPRRVPILTHDGSCHFEQLGLVLAVVGSRVRDVLQGDGGIHAKPLSDPLQALRAECPLGIDVDRLPLRPPVADGHLARHAEGVAELRLARAELAEHLRQRARLDAPLEQLVELG